MTNIEEDFSEYHVAVTLWTYVSPVLIVVGTIGNILSVVVLSRSSMRHSTTSLYLRVLAVVDILVLNTGLLRQWLLYLIDLDIRWETEVGCKIHTWAVYFSVHSSAWLLVAVTLERVLSVMFPHTVKMRCTRKAAYAIISTILIFFAILNVHYIFGIGSLSVTKNNATEVSCDGLSSEYYHFEQTIWPWIDMAFYSALPSTVLAISNFLIIRKVFTSDRRAKTLRNGSIQDDYNRKGRTSSMTLTLVAVSATYVICTTPFCIFVIYSNIFAKDLSPHSEAVLKLLWALANLLQYSNNSLNFLLYCVTGTRFRKELVGLVCRKKLVSANLVHSSGQREGSFRSQSSVAVVQLSP